jgi:curli biogenesis system outer membrane secretion channel CsgG
MTTSTLIRSFYRIDFFFSFPFLLILFFNCASTKPIEPQQIRYTGPVIRAAVIGGRNHNTQWNIDETSISDKLTHMLQRQGKYEIYERQSMQRIVDEQALAQSGIINENRMVQIGKLAGVQKLLIFNLNRYDFIEKEENGLFDKKTAEAIVALSVKVVDVAKGLIETTRIGEGKIIDKQKSLNTGGQARLASSNDELRKKLLNDALDEAIRDVAEQLSR